MVTVDIKKGVFYCTRIIQHHCVNCKQGFGTCVESVQIRSFSGPQDYSQQLKFFHTNSFVPAQSSAKKFNEQLKLKVLKQWYHMA